MRKKSGVNIPLIVTSFVLVCLVAVVAVLGVKAKKQNNVAAKESISDSRTEKTDYSESSSTTAVAISSDTESQSESDTSALLTSSASSNTGANVLTTIQQRVESTVTTAATTAAKATTAATTVIQTTVMGGAEVPVYNEEDLNHGAATTDKTAGSSASLPADMTFSGLYKSGYDVYGPKSFIFNDDTASDCTQRKFGYNPLYDAGAKLIDFSIDTVRVKFTYGGKPYMIQMWKGQYISGDIGTVGGEVGIYTRNPSKTYALNHYDCAAESDWLNCEMTIFWDENGDGNYKPQFTRKYSTHWWETGYVDGQLKNKKDSSPLRLMQRITFKDETQATAFASALAGKAFKAVETFSPNNPDTFKKVGKDVIYIWQYIKE